MVGKPTPFLALFCAWVLCSVGCDGTKNIVNDIDNTGHADNDLIDAGDEDILTGDDPFGPDHEGISDSDTAGERCGNGIIVSPEVCDGGLIDCIDIDPGAYTAGKAYCLEDCSGYDTSTCEEKIPPDETPDPDATQPDDTALDDDTVTPDPDTTVPDDTIPDIDTVTPDPDTVQPDDAMPDVDTVTPDPDTTVPDDTTPDVDTVTPDLDTTVPDDTTLDIDTVMPDPDTTVPDDTTPDTVTPDADTYLPSCGNGVVDQDEQCDDGLLNGAYGYCEVDCSGLGAHCGDAIKNGPEECDDANSEPCNDSCTSFCLTRKAFCGNSCLDAGEDCDDGNRKNGDGCNVDCSDEMEAIYVGNGTSTQRYPLGSYFGYERSASLYTAAEIGETGTILSIYWYVASACEVSVPRRVLMKQTTMTELSAVEWTAMTVDATEVYNNSEVFAMPNGWNGANTMTVEFKLQPGYNLLVLVEDNYGATGSTCADTKPMVRYSTATNRHEYWNANDNPPTIVGTVSSRRPNILLSMNNDTCIALSEPCDDQGDLSSSCHDSGNSYTCTCSTGFQYQSGSCYDVDECAAGDPCDNEGDADATCQNIVGSYTCYCGAGYYFNGIVCEAATNDDPITVTLPYNGSAQVISVVFDTYIKKADTMILVDRSGSMTDEHANLKAGINDVVITDMRSMIPDTAFGLVTFGTMEDQPYTLAQPITTDAAAMQAAVNGITEVGGASEIAYETLYQAATGAGVSYNDPGGCNSDPIEFTIPPTASGWRSLALPIFIMCTDEVFQQYTGLHTSQETYDALNAMHAKFIGMDSGDGVVMNDFNTVSVQTVSVTDTGAAFNATVPSDGSGLSEAIVSAVNAMISRLRFDVAIEALPVANGEGVDTEQFVELMTPVSGDPGVGNGYKAKDTGFFYGVRAGTHLTYDIRLRNTVFPNFTGASRSFTVTLRLLGAGEVLLGSRDITVVVPAAD